MIGQGGPIASAWTSDFNTDASGPDLGNIFVTSDNFTLTAAASINALTWQGLTFNANTKASATEPSSFTIQFRSDANGAPGALLYTGPVGYQESVAGTEDLFGSGNQDTVFNYSAVLPAAFSAAAATPYWVSIIGNTGFPGVWTWTASSAGNGSSFQQVYATDLAGGLTTGSRTQDRAFSLMNAVPEPPSLPLLFLGLLPLGLITARRRSRS